MIDILLSKLQKVKPNGRGKYTALCSVHSEKTPSLQITKLDDGRILMYCFGCGATGPQVMESVGLSVGDLFPDGAIQDQLMGWAQIMKVKEKAGNNREEAKDSNARLYLSACDAKRSKGEKLTVAELEQERVCYRRVNG